MNNPEDRVSKPEFLEGGLSVIDSFLSDAVELTNRKVIAIEFLIKNLGEPSKFFQGTFDGRDTNVRLKMHGKHIMRVVMNQVLIPEESLLIVDHAFVLGEGKSFSKWSTAMPKSDDDLQFETLLYEIWEEQNADRIKAEEISPYELLPGTMWAITPESGPVLSCDPSKGIVIANKHKSYEEQFANNLRNYRVRDSYGCNEMIVLLEDIIPNLDEVKIEFEKESMPE